MSLKIGFLTERLLLGFGVDLVAHQQGRYLIERGHEVEVFCLTADATVDRPYKVTNLTNCDGFVLTGSISSNLLILAEFINRQDIDIWVVHTSPFYEVIPLLKRPVIAIEYGTPPSSFFAPEIGRNLDFAVSYRFKHIFPRFRDQDKILSISGSIQNWLPPSVHRFAEVLYLGSNHYPEAEGSDAQRFRRALGIADDAVAMLWVGRIQVTEDQQPYKGFADFIQLAERLRAAEPELEIVVVGRGDKEAEAYLEERGLIPCLNLPEADMGSAYKACDVLVNTSQWEGFNLPLIESQFQGTPVVAYRHGPHPEVVQDGSTGFLVSSSEEMENAALSLVRDSGLREKLGQRARVFAREFSWQKNGQELERIIMKSVSTAASDGRKDSPAIAVSGWRRYAFLVMDTYIRYGLMDVARRTVKSFCGRLAVMLQRRAV
ncbi:glycosyltransferase family 4 protein [uncultured Pseudodesulfovibrio sp.]|uniref:glycosyltransferase family 4 protein n=1 Tax=uncultured Pseudodesulfovibrio sp. TaxID=2035858 RepID=UPI0029C870D6|nr:glycosyltransferase family 4 protein [uncultured Pseudodesulfovibrio sp.]